ncbi:MAG TPA: hypothetical protein VE197_23660 [Mycobacterium sp.]|nr:hypothetical protein [Mycobacterium sp.]
MAMSVKLFAAGVTAVAAIGAAAAGVTSVASGGSFSTPTAFQVQPVALREPLPLDPPPAPNQPPAPNLPTADQLSGICNSVTDPGVSYTTKTNLVQGGISPDEGHTADHDLRKAYRDGKFPLSFNVSNIQPAGPDAVTADVATSGPKLAAPVTQNLTFVNQDGNWIMRHDSAMALLQAATA